MPGSAEAQNSWGRGGWAPHAATLDDEYALERVVSEVIGAMPVLCLPVPDAAGPASARGIIEANAIALLSNRGRPPIDPPSPDWLGLRSRSAAVRESGVWNSNHVSDVHDPAFLGVLATHVAALSASPAGAATPDSRSGPEG